MDYSEGSGGTEESLKNSGGLIIGFVIIINLIVVLILLMIPYF